MKRELLDNELRHVDFGPDLELAGLLDGVYRLAADIDLAAPAQRTPAALQRAAACVAELQVEAVMPELDWDEAALPLLFQSAELLGHANPEAAWRGLHRIPAKVAGLPLDTPLVALPQHAPGRWTVWAPDGEWRGGRGFALTDGASWCARLPADPADPMYHSVTAHGLTGFGDATMIDLRLRDAALARPEGWTVWLRTGWERYRDAQFALLCGVLAGICRRLCEEAYAYARTRRSADKPIIQHQAVALRVAEIALQQQALALYLAATFKQGGRHDNVTRLGRPCVAYVNQAVFQVARDAVQVAAAHGYVEGLPFKRLFEQARTLSSALASYASSDFPFPEHSA
jgi:hypothetical protein